MTRRIMATVTVALLPLVGLLVSPLNIDRLETRAPASWAMTEDARLDAHFRDVLVTLSRSDVSELTPESRLTRERMIVALREYAADGVFPRNEGHARRRTPVFVDRHGTRCAMAHLIERSGHGALVARIAASANLATISTLAADRELATWLQRSGLSVAEASMIQPSYGPPSERSNPRENHRPDDNLMHTSALTTAFLGGAAAMLNLSTRRPDHERRQVAALGIIVGGAGLGVGMADWTSDGHLRGSGYFQLVAGTCSVAMSLINLAGIGRQSPSQAVETRLESETRRVEWGLVPGQAGEPLLAVTTRF